MTNTTPVQIIFTVEVDITTAQATYSYTNSQGAVSDGSATVTEPDTQIIYNLATSGLIFLEPQITGDTGHDLTVSISSDKTQLTLVDNDIDNENVCVILVVAKASDPSIPYPSPDPQIRNVPN
jgi:YbbR domain-containing protein